MAIKTTLYMATSLDGYIASTDGSEDFLSEENWEMFCKLARETGNLIWGRKTYEAVAKWNNGEYLGDLDGIEKIIISHNSSINIDGCTLASSPQDALDKLLAEGFQTALVSGGPEINAAFAKLGLLDEIILNIEPTIVGHGLPIFSPDDIGLQLELTSSSKSDSGIMTLRYFIQKRV